MTLTPLHSHESARKKFLMNSTYIMSKTWDQTFLGSRGRNESNTHHFARIEEKTIFDELDVHPV